MLPDAYRRLNHNKFLALIALLLRIVSSSRARAQASDAALAESLFRDGKRLMGESKFAEACPKFAESYRLDPGLGTLLNLAACHEAEGKIASAWAEFSDASARAKRDGDPERVAFADERVRSLEPRLAKITISLQAGASVPGLVVKLDGRDINPAAFGVAVPVDPGTHQVQASAPGKQPWSQTVQAPAQATILNVAVPPLQNAAAAPAAAAPAAPAPAPAAAQPIAVAPAAPAPAPAAEPKKKSKAPVIIVGALTGAALIGTVVTGVMYGSAKDDFENANNLGLPDRFSKRDSAQSLGVANAVLLGATVVGAGVTIVLLVTSSGSEEPPAPAAAKLELAPVIAPGFGGLSVQGRL
jgi:hypothetical protein